MSFGPEFTTKPMDWDAFDILTQFWIIKNQPDRIFRCINTSCWKGWYGLSGPGKIDVKKCSVCGSDVKKIIDILAEMEKSREEAEKESRRIHHV